MNVVRSLCYGAKFIIDPFCIQFLHFLHMCVLAITVLWWFSLSSVCLFAGVYLQPQQRNKDWRQVSNSRFAHFVLTHIVCNSNGKTPNFHKLHLHSSHPQQMQNRSRIIRWQSIHFCLRPNLIYLPGFNHSAPVSFKSTISYDIPSTGNLLGIQIALFIAQIFHIYHLCALGYHHLLNVCVFLQKWWF